MGSELSREAGKRGNRAEKNIIGILAFEVASAMSKCMQLWQSLSDQEVGRLRSEVTKGEGVLKLVSDSEPLLLSLACTEKLKELTSLAAAVARLAKKCENAALQGFAIANDIWNQIDAYTPKEMKAKIKKMGRYVGATAKLYLRELKIAKKRRICSRSKSRRWRRISLWNRSYDGVVELLARTVCTIHGRIVCVFGIGSQMVDSGGLAASTLGGAGLALHYSNAIILIANMVRFPELVTSHARDDLYNMLPHNIRTVLRALLKGLPIDKSPLHLAQCRASLEWLAPLAHNTIQWHSHHVFHLQVACHSNVLLLQTLYFADQFKAEAAIVDLLVGLTRFFLQENEKKVNVPLEHDIKDLEGIS